MSDNIYNPFHYTVYPVQPIEIAANLGFCLGNATKYVLRAPFKGGAEDCLKAERYLELERKNVQAPLFHHEYEMVEASIRRLVSFLLNAEGDILFGDIASRQIDYLSGLEKYLYHLDMQSSMKAKSDCRHDMIQACGNLRRVLELRDTVGQIYEGMTGLPKAQK